MAYYAFGIGMWNLNAEYSEGTGKESLDILYFYMPVVFVYSII